MTVATDPKLRLVWRSAKNVIGSYFMHAFSGRRRRSVCGKAFAANCMDRTRQTRRGTPRCKLCVRVVDAVVADRAVESRAYWDNADVVARFFRKTRREPTTGCLIWLGKPGQPFGYGAFSITNFASGPRQFKVGAHRFALAIKLRRWPHPAALHTCDNPICVEADHLIEGTQLDNMRDMARKRRRGKPFPGSRAMQGAHV